MKQTTHRHTLDFALLCGAVALLLVAAGCAPQAEEGAQQVAAPTLEEIPITTASTAARQLFDEGQYLLAVVGGCITLIGVWLVVEAALALRRYRREGKRDSLEIVLAD